jgi:hypothetical protein
MKTIVRMTILTVGVAFGLNVFANPTPKKITCTGPLEPFAPVDGIRQTLTINESLVSSSAEETSYLVQTPPALNEDTPESDMRNDIEARAYFYYSMLDNDIYVLSKDIVVSGSALNEDCTINTSRAGRVVYQINPNGQDPTEADNDKKYRVIEQNGSSGAWRTNRSGVFSYNPSTKQGLLCFKENNNLIRLSATEVKPVFNCTEEPAGAL